MSLKSMLVQLMDETAAHDTAINTLIDQLDAHFTESNIPITPFVALQVHDVLTQYRIARAIEHELFAQGVVEQNQPAPTQPSESVPAEKPRTAIRAAKRKPAWEVHSAVETLGKTWDRFRKALKELQDQIPNDAGQQLNKAMEDLNRFAGPGLKLIKQARKEFAEKHPQKENQSGPNQQTDTAATQ